MKTKLFLTTVAICLFSFSFDASGNSKAKKNYFWQKEFSKVVSYNQSTKNLLKGSVILLEVFIDERGLVRIENFNANHPDAANYVINKLNGLQLKELPDEQRFILKYTFK